MLVIEIFDDGEHRRLETDAECLVLGRTGDVFIDDRVVSRKHCEIRRQGADYIVRDLGSRNGTQLNLAPLDRPWPLADGDEIALGGATVRFWIRPSPACAANHAGDTAAATPVEPPPAPTATAREPAPPADQRPQQPPRAAPAAPPAAKARPRKSAPRPRIPREPAPVETPEPIPVENDLFVDDTGGPVVYTPPVEPSALKLDDIVPLNHEGKPAKAVDPRTGRVSEAMFRLKELLLRAFQVRSTDVHIEPKEEHHQIRYRIDGTLHALGQLETRLVRPIYSIVKLLCNLDINKRNVMMDGSLDIRLPDRRVQVRVSVAPSIAGDKMVMRILDTHLAPTGLDALSMEPFVLDQVRQKTAQNSSMLVVCGPTGSGKTTTAYAILREMDAHSRNIVTVEQPVEYKLENVIQIEVSADPHKSDEVTFSSALRSLLRQDPDVILVGEIRDADTARMAVQAAMTGHLLLSTVHARDAIGCVFRLLDLGVEPFLLASSLTAVLSQRLMRQLCLNCKRTIPAPVAKLTAVGLEELVGKEVAVAVGCDQCLGIGYYGRVPIFEMLVVNDQVRDAIANRPTIQQLRIAAGDWIYQTLREDGLRKLKRGLTSLEEFQRVAHQGG